MDKYKSLGFAALAAAALLAGPAFATATTCPLAPATGMQTQGAPVCIAPYGLDGSGTGLANILAGPTGPNSSNHDAYSIVSSGPGVNPYTDQTSAAYWSIGGSGSAVTTVMLQIAGNAEKFTFGIYQPGNTSNTLQLFGPGSANGATTFLSYNANTGVYTATVLGGVGSTATMSSSMFGFYLTTPQGNTFYSDAKLNSDGIAHQVAYDGNGKSSLTYANGQVRNQLWLPSEFIMAWEDLPFDQSDLDYNDFIVMVESVHPVPEPAVLGMFGFGVLLIGFAAGINRRRRPDRV